tara:strand:+ start:110 stop:523 length:414 start_codon:yes stop_codon:yes gene_type:complete
MKKLVIVFSLLVSTFSYSQSYTGYNGSLTVEDNVWVLNWSDQTNLGIYNELNMNGIYIDNIIQNALVLNSKSDVLALYNDLMLLKNDKRNITIERNVYKLVSSKKSIVIVNRSGDMMHVIKKYLKLDDIKESSKHMQ